MSHPPSPSSNNKQIDLTLIDEIGQSILSNLDRDSLLNSIISLLHQVFGFSKVTLYTLRGEDQNKLKKIGISGNGLEPEETYYYKKDSSPISECIALREEIVIQDKSPDNFLSPGKFDQETQSELVLPLLNGDSLIGILDLWAGNNNVFVAEVVQTFKLLAAKIATAIRNANLYRSEQLRRLVSERLQEVMRLASKDQSPDELYARILTELAAFFSYDAAGLWLLDAGLADNHDVQPASIYHLEATRYKEAEKEEAFASFFLSPGLADQQKNPLPWMSEVICQRKPLLGDNTSFNKPGGTVSEDEDQNSTLAAPLIVNDQVMGVIACVHHLPGQYDGESLPIIQVFSEYTSIAIENSKPITKPGYQLFYYRWLKPPSL
jgi:GAF domain-containing protein